MTTIKIMRDGSSMGDSIGVMREAIMSGDNSIPVRWTGGGAGDWDNVRKAQ
jgi:hypothetical protein